MDANLAEIGATLKAEQADFVVLQEVDIGASRSYQINEMEVMHKALPDMAHSFVRNFDTLWIPVPWMNPLGTVVSGLVTMSRWMPSDVTALALFSEFPLPDRWFTLKRRAMVSRFALAGHRLALINLHLSAFDQGGLIRRRQLVQLQELVLELYKKGYEVVAAGDWNHQLPEVPLGECRADQDGRAWLQPLPADFTPAGWHLATLSDPTVRTLGAPLGTSTCYATIDGALLSPGLAVVAIERPAAASAFAYTDHAAVRLELAFARPLTGSAEP